MSLLNKLKIVAGMKGEKRDEVGEYTHCEVLKGDSIDVVFAKTLVHNNGNFFYCDKKEDLIKTIQALTKKLNTNLIYCIEPILQELLSKSLINYENDDYLNCDAFLSSCEYLIAHHGKIMLSSKQLGANNIKNLPQEHIVVAYTSQIVKNLNEGMSGINTRYVDNLPSTITTITSNQPVEKNIVEGNIKNLSVLLIEDYQEKGER